LFDAIDNLLRGGAKQALTERAESVVGEVLLDVQRIKVTEVFGGDMDLMTEEGGDGRVAGIDAPVDERLIVPVIRV